MTQNCNIPHYAVHVATTATTATTDNPPHSGLQFSIDNLHAAIENLERALAALGDAAGTVLVGSQLAIPAGTVYDTKKDCPAPERPRSFVRCRVDEATKRVEVLRTAVADLIGRLDT